MIVIKQYDNNQSIDICISVKQTKQGQQYFKIIFHLC